MNVIVGGRQTGKTLKLIDESRRTGFYIVCFSPTECSRIFHMAKELGSKIPFPVSYDEFLGRECHPAGVRGFLIDNVNMLIARLSMVEVGAVSFDMGEGDSLLILKEISETEIVERFNIRQEE